MEAPTGDACKSRIAAPVPVRLPRPKLGGSGMSVRIRLPIGSASLVDIQAKGGKRLIHLSDGIFVAVNGV